MSFIAPLIGAAASIGAAALQAPPSGAYRQSSDYNPVTTIFAPGTVDFQGISDLLTTINSENAYVGGLHGNLTPTSDLLSPFSKGTNLQLLLIAGVAFATILIWRKYG